MSKTILLTNGRSPAGLDLLRSLSKSGHRVIVADSFPVQLCRYSRYGRCVKVPAPNKDPHCYLEAIQQIVTQFQVDLIIPVYEEIFFLAHYKEKFAGVCEVLCDEFELLARLHNKFEFNQTCREFGLTHPSSRLLRSADEYEDEGAYVLKPAYSRFGTNVHLKPSQEQVRKLKFDHPWVMQEFIEGRQYCVYCLADRGKILAMSTYTMDVTLLGVSISFQQHELPEIDRWVTSFVEQCHFTGSISFDFIHDGQTAFPIECNPRVTSGIHLFSNDPEFVEAIVNKKPHPQPRYQQAMVGPFVFAKALINWKLWGTYWRSRDVLFNWTDPFPLLGKFFLVAYLRFRSRWTRTPVSEISSSDIEWNGETLES